MMKHAYLRIIKTILVVLIPCMIALCGVGECGPKRAVASQEDPDTKRQALSAKPLSVEEREAQSTVGGFGTSAFTREHARFARATLDAAFKHMLLDDEDREPLLSFLRAFTDIPIVSATHISTTLPTLRMDPEEKQTFLDLACRDDKGNYFLVEVQVKEQDYWNPRALYYAAGVYSQQLNAGEHWRELRPVIALNILDHDRKTLPEGEYKRDFQLLDRNHLHLLRAGTNFRDPAQLPYVRIIQCELPRVSLETVESPLLRQWLQLFRESGTLTDIPEGVSGPVHKAYERLEFDKWGSGLRGDYEKETLHLEEYQGIITRTREEGLAEGLERGKKDIARRLLATGMDRESVGTVTGLSLTDLEGISEEGAV